MFERFTERARKVIILAREEAIRLGHDSVGTEHLLLGLVREGEGRAVAVLKTLKVDIDVVKSAIEKTVPPGKEVTPSREMPFTAGAKKMLEYAISEARSLRHNYIGTEHLLLGLIREGEGIASQVLRGFDVSVAVAKATAIVLLEGKSRQTSPEGPQLRFERFTERARQVIILAREEAIRLGHDFVGTEHLLLGLIREEDGVALAVFKKLNVDIGAVKGEIEKLVPGGKDVSPHKEIPFTPEAKKVLEYAISEARSLGQDYIGTEHLLLGLIREGEGIASLVLRDFGVSMSAAKAQVIILVGEKPTQASPEGPRLALARFTEQAQGVILLAREEAILLGQKLMGPEHLFLGLIGQPEGIASRVLLDLGVSVAAAKAKILELLEKEDPATPSVP